MIVRGTFIPVSGALTEVSGSPFAIPSSVGKTKEQHAFLGFTDFEK